MPAFTTNVEFGSFVKSGKVVFGAPDSAPGNKYLKHLATKFGVPQESTLQSTVDRVLDILDPYALRTGGERFVPLNIWRTPSFQAWYGSLVAAGNVLNYACVKWSSSSVPGEVPFAWVLHVEVFVTSEGRVKSNEVVFARPDISTVLVYERAATLTECRVLLVKEFRSPGRTPSGFIQELPGGSSHDPGVKPREVAFEELWEEAGLRLDSPAALTFEGSRQLMGTFSSHQAHLFSFQVSSSKMDELVESVGSVLGAPGDSERTYVEVSTVGDLLDPVSTSVVDFSTLGMVLSVLAPLYA
jgi:8-oxo-dGTP pyrophosphatase MutT (NUDIX family)